MLHLTDLQKSFGSQVILDGASLHVKPAMRVGLVGPNGAGKTTLLRIISGEMSADGGEVSTRKDLRIGFLPQEIESLTGSTPIEEVLAGYADVLDMEHRIRELGERLADPSPQHDGVLEELGRLQTAFEASRGYELEARAETILRGMGFTEADFHRSIEELSGGWRMRVALARLLMERPDLLLLDEPTNHLDLESLLWLEEFLLEWEGSLIVISHDRYFLNRLVTHIVELDRGTLDLYAGDYDYFESEKRRRYETLVNAAKNQQREIDQAESFIRRFRAKNTKAKQVQQKIKQLERMEAVDVPDLERKEIRFRFPQPGRIGRVAAELSHVRKVYGDTVVYRDLNLVVERGEKIALVGPNGAGKSTLMKLLAGVVEPDGGLIRFGHNVRQEYFAQHQLEVFDPAKSVLKTMEEAAGPVDRVDEVRDFLGAFLFTGDDVDKTIAVLSGGEKARLALARMLLDPAGLLLLDEPTNHLDMVSRQVLTEALRQFEGSIIFISHDRHLINAIGTKVIEVEGGRLTHYPGDWEYYRWKKGRSGWSGAAAPDGGAQRESAAGALTGASRDDPSTGASSRGVVAGDGAAGSSAGGAQTASGEKKGSLSREHRKDIRRRHARVEKKIMELEQREEHLAGVLSDEAHAGDYELLARASDEAEEVRSALAGLYDEWEALSEQVVELDSG